MNQVYVPFPELAYGRWTAPAKREFRKGVAARKADRPLKDNPWNRSLGGRNYYVFEDSWNRGWRACDAALNKGTTA